MSATRSPEKGENDAHAVKAEAGWAPSWAAALRARGAKLKQASAERANVGRKGGREGRARSGLQLAGCVGQATSWADGEEEKSGPWGRGSVGLRAKMRGEFFLLFIFFQILFIFLIQNKYEPNRV